MSVFITPPIADETTPIAGVGQSDQRAAEDVATIRLDARSIGVCGRVLRRLRIVANGVYWRRRFGGFGWLAYIERPVWLQGHRGIYIGDRAHIRRGARIEAFNNRDGESRIIIGQYASIHPDAHIAAATRVKIGQGVLIAASVYITDHDHDFQDPDEPPISNRRIVVAPVEIGAYAWLGERVMVLKGVTIGEHAVIGAGSIVTQDIPAYSLAVGSPARVVRRWCEKQRRWKRV